MDRTTQEAAALERGAGIRRLDDHVVLEIAGEDAHEWLAGQVTNAVRQTAPGDAVYALFTTVKGKILADAFLLHVAHEDDRDTLYAVVPGAARDPLLESFDKYIVMEDVDVRVRADLAVLTVQGPAAAERVAQLGEPTFPSDRLGTGGVDVVVATERADAVFATLAEAGATPVSEAGWELARLRLEMPRFGRDFDDRNYPQEAGLRRRAVSFTKGCYIGQEVVCMLESRGKLSKRLVALELEGDEAAAPDAPLEGDGAEVGRITSSVVDPEANAVRALGYLKAAFAEPGRELSSAGRRARVARIVE